MRAVCRHEGSRYAGCLQVRYCSRECQKSDWPAHKLVFKVFSDCSNANRPSKDARQVFLFAEDSELPQFAWVRKSSAAKEAKTTTNGEDFIMVDKIPPLPLRYHLGNLDDFLSEDGTMKAERVNPVVHRQTGHGLVVMGRYRMDLSKDFVGGHWVNKSLLKIYQEQAEIWSGNVVAYSCSDETKRVLDVDPVDFRNVVDIFRHIFDHTRREHLKRFVDSRFTGAVFPCAAEKKLGCRTFKTVPCPQHSVARETSLYPPS